MSDQQKTTRRTAQKATRIPEDSFTFNRLVPALLIALSVSMVVMLLASVAVITGII